MAAASRRARHTPQDEDVSWAAPNAPAGEQRGGPTDARSLFLRLGRRRRGPGTGLRRRRGVGPALPELRPPRPASLAPRGRQARHPGGGAAALERPPAARARARLARGGGPAAVTSGRSRDATRAG